MVLSIAHPDDVLHGVGDACAYHRGFRPKPCLDRDECFTSTKNGVDLVTNLVDVAVFVLVMNAVALAVLEARRLFDSLRKSGALFWKMPMRRILQLSCAKIAFIYARSDVLFASQMEELMKALKKDRKELANTQANVLKQGKTLRNKTFNQTKDILAEHEKIYGARNDNRRQQM